MSSGSTGAEMEHTLEVLHVDDVDSVYECCHYPPSNESGQTESTLRSIGAEAVAAAAMEHLGRLSYYANQDIGAPKQSLTEGALRALDLDNNMQRFDVHGWCKQMEIAPGNVHAAQARRDADQAAATAVAPTASTTRTRGCRSLALTDTTSSSWCKVHSVLAQPVQDEFALHINGVGMAFPDMSTSGPYAGQLDEDLTMNDTTGGM